MRIVALAIVILTAVSCSKFTKIQKSNDYDYKLKMADEYFEKKKYNYASQLYTELFPIYKGNPKFEDLFYKFAYCSYYLRDYLQAENLFKQFTEVFPTSARAEEMEYMRAFTYYRQSPKQDLDQTNTLKAIGLMQTFINTHPNSGRLKEANTIIENLRNKLEAKDYKSAELYYNMGQYRAAAIAYTSLINSFPDTKKGDEYKLQAIKSYYLYAENSVEDKKAGRYEQVINEVNDFNDRYPDSQLKGEAERYSTLSQNNIKQIQNEQAKTTNQR
ncbi:MAG: outer membrane protein assembly factor BamD [Chitinophagaceae bacterium]|nr:outer membrane protein assembly factor BamD [Chitinophagaceae bacterium]